MLENFTLGILAIAKSIAIHFRILLAYPFFWGFGVGFLVAAIISSLVILENPTHIYRILYHKDPARSFKKIAKKDKRGVYLDTFSEFQSVHVLVRFLFGASIFIFMVIVLFILLFTKF